MKLYKIVFNKYDYDQFDAFIVRAENEKDVIKLLKKNYSYYSTDCIDYRSGFSITEIKAKGVEEIILGSYNAG